MKAQKPIILAHRGFSSKYPENTLLSFKQALNAGADGWECDVQKTKDGKFVIIHDDTVDRVSKQKGSIKDMALKDVKNVRLDKKQAIPELEMMLKLLPENKFLNLELKADTITPIDCPFLYRILRNYREPDNLLISSFNIRLLDFFREKKIPVGLLIGQNVRETGVFRFFRTAFHVDPDYFNFPVEALKGTNRLIAYPLIKFLKARGNKLAFWVVNNEQDLDLCLPLADILMTDDPEWLNGVIGKRSLSPVQTEPLTRLPHK